MCDLPHAPVPHIRFRESPERAGLNVGRVDLTGRDTASRLHVRCMHFATAAASCRWLVSLARSRIATIGPGRGGKARMGAFLRRQISNQEARMRLGYLRPIIVLAALAAILAFGPEPATGQASQPAATKARAVGSETAPRTSWGDPDLQGRWTNTTTTP